MLVKQWSFGDRVVHTGRPEWGTGHVQSATPDTHDGKPCQRLSIRFERAGIKTISSAFATLVPAEDAPALMLAEPPDAHTDDPLAAAMAGNDAKSAREIMLKIPQAASDPFATPRSRLAASLSLYKFSEHGGSLLDWAAVQSGLKDPMTRFNRHELEDLFRRWTSVRDEHLKRLVFELKKNEPGLLAEVARTAPRGAQQMLRRLDALR